MAESESLESEYRAALDLLRNEQFDRAMESFKQLSVYHIESRAYYGWLLERGRGCAKDVLQARALYQSASEAGSKIAQYFLGSSHWRRGDADEGVAWLKRAAAQNDAPAIYLLSRAYRIGRGVGKDTKQARHYLEQAAALGHLYALRDIQYYSMAGEYGVLALVRAPLMVLPALLRIARVLLRAPNDPRIAR
jgi:TPR repeat protein